MLFAAGGAFRCVSLHSGLKWEKFDGKYLLRGPAHAYPRHSRAIARPGWPPVKGCEKDLIWPAFCAADTPKVRNPAENGHRFRGKADNVPELPGQGSG